jgi:hypothetical protein
MGVVYLAGDHRYRLRRRYVAALVLVPQVQDPMG